MKHVPFSLRRHEMRYNASSSSAKQKMSQPSSQPSEAQLQRRKELRSNYAKMMFGDDTRGRLLRATAVGVARHGTRACTVQHILDEAQLSRRTFYKTFTSLEDALNALYEVAVRVLKHTMSSAISRARTPLGKVIAALDTYLEMQILGGPLITALQREAMHDGSPLAVHRHELVNGFVELIRNELFPIATLAVDDNIALSIVSAAEGLVGWTDRQGPFLDEDRLRIRHTLVLLLTRTFGFPLAVQEAVERDEDDAR